MSFVQESVERLVTVLSRAGWRLDALSREWRAQYASGIPIEMTLPRDLGDIFITHPGPDKRVCVSLVDKNAAEYVEFGFDYDKTTQLENALQALIAVQQDVTPQSIAPLLRTLLAQHLNVRWEHQEEELEPVTRENVESGRFRMPLLR